MGGQLGGKRDPSGQHADSLLRVHFTRYQKTLAMSERTGRVVGPRKISKGADKYIVRKLWVAI
jgi:hypothetical protein